MTSSSATAATVDAAFTAEIDFSIWKAIAGSSVKVPSPGSRVYYFPEGHAEHINNFNSFSISSSSTAIVSPVGLQPFYPCRVVRVQFLADPQSEQVVAKMLLLPGHGNDDGDMRDANFAIKELHGEGKGEVVEADKSDVLSFSKILTPSDANNGGGFSVPRFCADSIFPPLDFDAEPPVQNLFITDTSGKVFEFRHIYRGTPRRHLLTTGWSKFVNSKKLVAGDSVVFMRKKTTGKLFVGVRRALKGSGETSSRWSFAAIGAGTVMLDQNGINNVGNAQGFWGSVKGKPVLQAVEMATKGMAFEVLYYPRPGWADFVVNAEMVECSMNVQWNAGMRIKMSMETEDSSRMTWSHGTVLSIHDPDNGLCRGFPWRMLQAPSYATHA